MIALLIAILNTGVLACPMCKDSVPNSDAQAAGSLPSGMNTSVYFMLGGLFLVIGMVSGIVIKGVRDTNQRHGGRGFGV
jgi:heme/copper-type cytochrome/quinol oxidase subunit 2